MHNILTKQMKSAGIEYHQNSDILIPEGLPILFSIAYRLYEAVVETTSVILAVDKQSMHLTPKAIKKQIDTIAAHYKCPAIYAGGVGIAHLAKRLTEYKVPHIIPGRRIYLPFTGISILKPDNIKPVNNRRLSKSDQLLCLAVLLHKIPQEFTVLNASTTLKTSRPTIIAAVQELEQRRLLHRKRKSASKCHFFSFFKNGKVLWEQIYSYP